MNPHFSNEQNYHLGCQGYNYHQETMVNQDNGSNYNYWAAGNDQSQTLIYAEGTITNNTSRSPSILNSDEQRSLQTTPLDGQLVPQNYNPIQQFDQYSGNAWNHAENRCQYQNNYPPHGVYQDQSQYYGNNYASMPAIGEYNYNNGNEYGTNIQESFTTDHLQPPPYCQFQKTTHALQHASSPKPNPISIAPKYYNAIKNKRPQLKMKTNRKKRCAPGEPIPYANRNVEKKFVCEFDQCGFKASQKSNITRHIEAMHEPHYIICCHRLFPTKTHFEAHRLQIHEDGTFACIVDDCTRKFNRKSLLHKHEERYHFDGQNRTITCSICLTILPHPENDKIAVFNHAVLHSSRV